MIMQMIKKQVTDRSKNNFYFGYKSIHEHVLKSPPMIDTPISSFMINEMSI